MKPVKKVKNKHKNKSIALIILFIPFFILLNTCSLDRYIIVQSPLDVNLTFDKTPANDSGTLIFTSNDYPNGFTLAINVSGAFSADIKFSYTLALGSFDYVTPSDPNWQNGTEYVIGSTIPITTGMQDKFVYIKAIAYVIEGGYARYSSICSIQFKYKVPPGTIKIIKTDTTSSYCFTTTATINISIARNPAEDSEPWNLRYTTDGSLPTRTTGTAITGESGSIGTIASTTTVTVLAYKSSLTPATDKTQSAVFTKTGYVVAVTPDKTPGTYVTGTTVNFSCATPNVIIKYNMTTDDTLPDTPTRNSGTIYTQGANFTLSTVAARFAFIAYVDGWETSSDYSSAIIFNCPAAPTPVFDSPSGTVFNNTSATITLTSDTTSSGITYYYEIAYNSDPANPTTSSVNQLYSSNKTITLTDSEARIKIYSVRTGSGGPYLDSPVKTFTYRLKLPTPVVNTSTSVSYLANRATVSVTADTGILFTPVLARSVSYTATPPAEPVSTDAASLSLSRSSIYKFKSYQTGWEPSDTVTATYNVKNSYTAITDSGNTTRVYLDQITSPIETVSSFTVKDISVNEGVYVISGSSGGTAAFKVKGRSVVTISGYTNAKAVHYTGGIIYLLLEGGTGYAIVRYNISGTIIGTVRSIAPNGTMTAYDIKAINGVAYVSQGVGYTSPVRYFCAIYHDDFGSNYNPFYFNSNVSSIAVYAGKMVVDGSNLHVIGFGDNGSVATLGYWKVSTSPLSVSVTSVCDMLITEAKDILIMNGSVYLLTSEQMGNIGTYKNSASTTDRTIRNGLPSNVYGFVVQSDNEMGFIAGNGSSVGFHWTSGVTSTDVIYNGGVTNVVTEAGPYAE